MSGVTEIKVLGEGPVPADIMIVGQNPGRLEASHGRPFIGPSGRMLDEALTAHGLDRRAIYVTNAVKTYYPGNPRLTAAQIAAEQPDLIAEVSRVKPRLVLVLGAPALKALVGRGDIGESRGKDLVLHRVFGHDAQVVATYHPAAIMRDRRYEGKFTEDMARFARIAKGEFNTIDTTYVLNQPFPAEVNEAYLDVETSAGVLCLVGLRPRGGPSYLYNLEGFGMASVALSGLDRVVAWQAAFDVSVIEEQLGVTIKAFDDPMLKVYLLDEEARQDLKSNAMKYLGVEAWEHGIRGRLARGEEPLGPALYQYNSKDLTYMEAVDTQLTSSMTSMPALVRVYENLLIPATRMFMSMQKRGIYISSAAVTHARVLCGLLREKSRVSIHKQVGEFTGPGGGVSSKKLAKILYDELGLPVLEYTETGSRATNKLTLKRLRGKHPVIEDILRYKEAERLAEFVEKYQDLRDSSGRVHPTTFLTFTVTGRTSNADPNVQQLPRNDVVRRIVAAPPGKKLVVADQSQIELRVIAYCANERAMRGAYQRGDDVHRLMAARITGKRPSDVTKDERYKAKPVNFGFGYCAEALTYQEQVLRDYDLVISLDEAQKMYEAFHSMWPDIYAWWARCFEEIDRQGYIESMFGRRRRLPNIHSTDENKKLEALRQGINFTVQSAASDIMLLGAIELYRRGAPIVAYIHDAVILEVDEADAEFWAQETKQVMEAVPLEMQRLFGIEFDVPLVADVEITNEWHGVVSEKWLDIDGSVGVE